MYWTTKSHHKRFWPRVLTGGDGCTDSRGFSHTSDGCRLRHRWQRMRAGKAFDEAYINIKESLEALRFRVVAGRNLLGPSRGR